MYSGNYPWGLELKLLEWGGKKNLDGKFWFYFVWAKSANTFFYLSKCGREMILLGWDLLFFYVLVEMQAEQSVETRLTWSTASVTSAVMGFWLTPRVQTTFFGPPHGRAQQRSEKKSRRLKKPWFHDKSLHLIDLFPLSQIHLAAANRLPFANCNFKTSR